MKKILAWTGSQGLTRGRIARFLGLAILFVLLIMITYPILFTNFSTMIPRALKEDLLYIASIINYSINAPLNEVYHLPYFYPTPYVITYGHPLFGISAVFKIFQIFRLNFYQSYNLYVIFTLLLGALGCYFLAREISNSRLFSLVFASFYILFDRNYLHFIWLNFLSHAYFPFIFYFFIRYMKTGKKVHLLAGSCFAFCQFCASVYYGFYLWVFILPLFLLFSLALKICDWKKFLGIAAGLLVAFSLILLIYHPFLTVKNTNNLNRNWNEKTLLSPNNFFNSPKILHNMRIFDLGKYRFQRGYKFIPGYVFTFFFLAFFTVFLAKRRKIYLALLCILFLAANALFFESELLLEAAFLLLCLFVIFLTVLSWKNMDGFVKVILLTLTASLLFIFQFRQLPVLKDVSLLKMIFDLQIVPGMSGLRFFSRLIPICTPFLIAMAATAAARCDKSLNATVFRSSLFAAMIVLLLFLENYNFFSANLINSIPTPEIYRQLPYQQNKIILELPFYGIRTIPVKATHETRSYMYNWILHRNYLLNGWTAFFPKRYFLNFKKVVPRFDSQFPNEAVLKKLIDEYSLTHILFHWDKLDEARDPMRENLKKISRYGKITYQDDHDTILQVQEFIPVTRLTRTLSYVHLRYHSIEIVLRDPYQGSIQWFLNGRPLPPARAAGRRIVLDLRKEGLAKEKNRIDLVFGQEIRLDEFIIH
jgi:hypothetical protein